MKPRWVVLTTAALASVAPANATFATWHNVVSRTWVSDIAVVGDAVWISYLGGGAAFYDERRGQVEFFTAADGLGHNYVTAVVPAGDALFFATRNGVTRRDAAGNFHVSVRLWGCARNDCTDAATDGRYLYVATTEGARCYDLQAPPAVITPPPKEVGPANKLSPQIEDGWKVIYHAGDVVVDELYSVSVVGDEVFWGGRGRLLVSNRGATAWRELDIQLPADAVVNRVAAADPSLVVATSQGVFFYHDHQTEPATAPLDKVAVYDYLRHAGLEYYATADGLLVRRSDGEPFKFIIGSPVETEAKKGKKKKAPWWRVGNAAGLPVDHCTALAPAEETVWVGTTAGAARLDPSAGTVRVAPIPKGLPTGGVYALAYFAGALWSATPEGLAVISETDYTAERVSVPGITAPVIDLYATPDELVVTTETDVVTLSPARKVTKKFDLARTTLIRASARLTRAVRAEDRYWLGTTVGLLEVDSKLALWEFYGHAAGHAAGPVRALLLHHGKLWYGTAGGGIAIMDAGGFAVNNLRAGQGISADTVFSLAADDRYVYAGTYDRGLDVLGAAGEFIRNVSWGDGLSHTDVWAAASDGEWLWLSVRGVGINALRVATLAAEPNLNKNKSKGLTAVEVRRYYARYGLGDEYVRAVITLPPRDGKKRVAFGTASGVAILEYEGDPPDLQQGDPDANYP